MVAVSAAACGDDSPAGETGPNVAADTFPTLPGYEVSDDTGVTDPMASLTIFAADPPVTFITLRVT